MIKAVYRAGYSPKEAGDAFGVPPHLGMTDMTPDTAIYIEEKLLYALKTRFSARVNELLAEAEDPIPPIETGGYGSGFPPAGICRRASPYQDPVPAAPGERFTGDSVGYRINGTEYRNIYGLTLSTKKEGGTETDLWIKRAATQGHDLPELIEELTITAQLYREQYEYRRYGMFRLTLSRLVLTADETAVDSADALIGPVRYYVAGTVQAETFTTDGMGL